MEEYKNKPGDLLPLSAPLENKEEQKLRSRISWKAILISYGLAYYYVAEGMGLLRSGMLYRNSALFIFAGLYVLGVEHLAYRMRLAPKGKEDYFFLCCLLAVCAVVAFLKPMDILSGVELLFIHGTAIYYTMLRLGGLIEKKTGSAFLLDLIYGTLIIPWQHFFLRLRVIIFKFSVQIRPKKKRHTAFIGVGLGLIFGAVVWRLLCLADEAFEVFSQSLHFLILHQVPADILLTFLLSLPVGQWLFGLCGGSLIYAEKKRKERLEDLCFQMRIFPKRTILFPLGVLCAIYFLFFIIQGKAYLIILLKEELTAAMACRYAVRGFSQLCFILLINFGLLALAQLGADFEIRKEHSMKIAATGILFFSFLFLFLAGLKLFIYIIFYGLTIRRALAAWVLTVLLAGEVLTILWLYKKEPIPAVRWGVFFGEGSFVLLAMAHYFLL